jgi:hypothetical protein
MGSLTRLLRTWAEGPFEIANIGYFWATQSESMIRVDLNFFDAGEGRRRAVASVKLLLDQSA